MALPPSKTPSNIQPAAPTVGDAFLREVDEEVRRDQLVGFWKRWGVTLGVGVVALLAALGGWLWWQDDRKKQAGAAGVELATAIDKMSVGDNAAARPVLEKLAKDGPGGYAALARFMQAADRLAMGEDDKAAGLYEALAADEAVDPLLRDAATIRMVRLRFDAMTPDAVVAKLKPYAAPGNPWFGLAGEMTAMAQIKAGTPELAKPVLIAIVKDDALPPSLRNRAAQLALALGVAETDLGVGEGGDGAGAVAPEAGAAPAAPVGDAE